MTAKEQRKGFEKANVICARIILEHPNNFGGEDSLMVTWARQILGQAAQQRRAA